MTEALSFLAAPFLACLILVAVLGYFGLHVLRREVIFVDLALAQIAALGTIVGLLLGHEPGSPAAFGYSLAMTIAGAALFSATRSRGGRVPQEAIIGLTYVVASAAAILLADRAPEGAEHIKELLAGAIVWVTWPAVARLLIVTAAVGAFHAVFRRRFARISEDAENARSEGVHIPLWDFLFYLSFGLVIVLAVEVAGVLMVFAYLVAPAIVAIASSRRWGRQVSIAWLVGVLGSAAGLAASYRFDFPSGPAIVCALAGLLLLSMAWRRLQSRLHS